MWDFGDGTPLETISFPAIPNTTHSYAVTGSFNVTLSVTNSEGCSHSFSRLVNVFGAPTSEFMHSGQCKDSPVQFTDLTSVSGNQNLTEWYWDFGDPASGISNLSREQNPSHTYAAVGTYTVQLITLTANGCSDTITRQVVVKPLPVTDFSVEAACQDNPALFTPSGMATTTITSRRRRNRGFS